MDLHGFCGGACQCAHPVIPAGIHFKTMSNAIILFQIMAKIHGAPRKRISSCRCKSGLGKGQPPAQHRIPHAGEVTNRPKTEATIYPQRHYEETKEKSLGTADSHG